MHTCGSIPLTFAGSFPDPAGSEARCNQPNFAAINFLSGTFGAEHFAKLAIN